MKGQGAMKKYFSNLKIGTKLIAAFASILVLYILTVLVSVHTIQNMSEKMDDLYNQPFAKVEACRFNSFISRRKGHVSICNATALR